MLWLAAIGLLLGLTWIYQKLGAGGDRAAVQTEVVEGKTMVALQRNRGGHYVADGAINGTRVTFLVDTGATDVGISASLASRLGLKKGPPVMLQTANGVIRGNMTRIDQVSIGGITLHNVRATIGPDSGPAALLGMSFLGRLDWEQEGDRLLLKQRAQ